VITGALPVRGPLANVIVTPSQLSAVRPLLPLPPLVLPLPLPPTVNRSPILSL